MTAHKNGGSAIAANGVGGRKGSGAGSNSTSHVLSGGVGAAAATTPGGAKPAKPAKKAKPAQSQGKGKGKTAVEPPPVITVRKT